MEKAFNIRIGERDGDAVLKVGEACELHAVLPEYDPNGRYSLYFTGESRFFSAWRDEIDYQHLYGLIDDSLNCDEAEGARYCLDFSMWGGENYVKRAVKKIVWKPSLFDVADLLDGETDGWNCGIYAKARGLRIEKGGFLRLRFEVRYIREGKDNRSTDNPPDRVETVDISEGSYGYRHFSDVFDFPKETTACVMVYLEGYGYSGEVYFERPHVISETGYNILPDFSTSVQNRPFFDWYGCNLSKREWPSFKISVNGKTVFDGELFETMHRYPSFEVDVPKETLFEGNNSVEIKYTGGYREPAPFALHDVKIINRHEGILSVIGHGENAALGGELAILIRTGKDGVKACLECENDEVECLSELYFDKAGLHSVIVSPTVMKNDLTFFLVCEGERVKVTVPHICKKENDGVITGTGDAVYVNFDTPEHFERFFEWYTENNIGELLTLRPIYRWGGTRTLSEESWRRAASLLDSMNYKYSMMTDGRDIPGYDKHPTPEMISGKGFLGYQLHERDGQFFYWNYRGGRPRQNFQILDEFYDICMRLYRESPVTMSSVYKPCNVKMEEGKYSLRMDTRNGDGAEALADGITRQLSDIRDHFTRHTGPAVNFRSFFKADYKWLGAETMYASTELQMAFLRGASRAYGAESMGVHAAVQWSTRPHDSETRLRLYRLALYVPYVCGATEINTEEGLYRIESGYAAYDRFSSVCRAHLEQQKDFNRYVTSHTRRGRLYSPIALIYGRDDTWTGYFTSSNVICGRPDMPSGVLSRSWELLNVFYPDSCVGSSKKHTVRSEENSYMYTATPFGNIDVTPIEDDLLSRYRLISFAGYNRAVESDMDKLRAYVENGGKLIIGLPHLSRTADYRDVLEYRLEFSDNAILSVVGGVPSFIPDTYHGKIIRVSTAVKGYDRVLEHTDTGKPLAVSVKHGEGEIILINALEYPGEDSVSDLYADIVRAASEDITFREESWIETGEDSDIEFSAYDTADGTRYFYLIATDVHRDTDKMRRAWLRIGEDRYAVSLPFGVLVKIAVKDGVAVWSDNESVEIDPLTSESVRTEGIGEADLFVAKKGKITKNTLCFDRESEKHLKI